jgi:hypothetical protein
MPVSLVGFVRLYLRAGRLWLAWTVCGLRTLSLDAGWQLSLLLLVIFVADAAFSVWRMITAAGCELVRLAAKAGVVPAEHV